MEKDWIATLAVLSLVALAIPGAAQSADGLEEELPDAAIGNLPRPQELATPAGAILNLAPRGTTSTQLGCFDWDKNQNDFGAVDKCTRTGPTQTYSVIGIYFCPKKGAHRDCDNFGDPTDGTVDAGIYWGDTLTGAWCIQFSDGEVTNQCQPQFKDIHANKVQGGSVFGTNCCHGTYGAFYR